MIDAGKKPPTWVITGPRDSGKTTLCELILESMGKSEVTTTGILSKGIYLDGKKVAIEVINLADRSKKILAQYSPGWDVDFPQREWEFCDETLYWGDEVLRGAVPTGCLIIDELGFLEMEKNKGWLSAFTALDSLSYNLAIVTIRPGFAQPFQIKYPHSIIYRINDQTSINVISHQILADLKRIFDN
jgi:nucleoside-triphosphatase THEP1